MKHNNLFLWLLGLTVCWLASCSEEDGRVTYPYSCPEISELQFSTTDQTPAADSLYFSVKIHDPQTPLSTLEVKLMTGETLVSSQSIRTKGTDVSIVEKGIYIPFEAGLEENQEAKVILTAINVEGSEVTQTFDFHITRPQIPEVLYLHYNGEVVEMNRSEDNPYLVPHGSFRFGRGLSDGTIRKDLYRSIIGRCKTDLGSCRSKQYGSPY